MVVNMSFFNFMFVKTKTLNKTKISSINYFFVVTILAPFDASKSGCMASILRFGVNFNNDYNYINS